MRYHDSDRFMVGGVDTRLFKCPSCPFEGGEDDMIQHAMDAGHIAQPVATLPIERRKGDRRHEEEMEMARMSDGGCPHG